MNFLEFLNNIFRDTKIYKPTTLDNKMSTLATYKHDLGRGLFLEAHSLDPNLRENALQDMVSSKDGTSMFNLENLEKDMQLTGRINSFADLNITASSDSYEIPRPLKAYRDALVTKLTQEGKFNGPIAVVKGAFTTNFTICPGGYFDFMATKLEVKPSELVLGKYLEGKTIEESMPEWEMTNDQRARFFAFAFLMQPNNGKDISLVQRAKGLGIAADCISSSGSTPEFHEDFFKPGFNFTNYLNEHLAREMKEEYGLNKTEFEIGGADLIDDKRTIPHLAIRIKTPLSMDELAEKSAQSEDALKEHPVLYSMPTESVNTFLNRFDMWPSIAFALHHFDKGKK